MLGNLEKFDTDHKNWLTSFLLNIDIVCMHFLDQNCLSLATLTGKNTSSICRVKNFWSLDVKLHWILQCVAGHFFSNFIFVYLWTSFKISFSTLKKSVFQAIFKFKLVSQPFYSFYWPGNWDSNLKLNLLRSFHHLELPEIFLSHVVLIHRGLSIFHFLGPNLF